MEIEYDESGAPQLLKVAHRILALERMRDHRLEGLSDVSRPGHRGKIGPGTAEHFRSEVKALEVAIAACRYHRATLEGLPEFISVLRVIVANRNDPEALQAAAKRAQLVLEEYDRTAALQRAG